MEALTEEIRQASDIVDVVGAYVRLHRNGRNFRALCPFHNEKTPSFHVRPAEGHFKCFGCNAGGDVFKFIQLKENIGFREARALLAQRAGISLELETGAGKSDGLNKLDLFKVNEWALRWFQRQFAAPEGRRASDYARSRGLAQESIQSFSLGFAPERADAIAISAGRDGVSTEQLLSTGLLKRSEDGRVYAGFRDRLMFPIRDAMNRVLGFGGRALGDHPAKYLNSPQSALFDKSRCVYAVDLAKNAMSAARAAVVVEGYLDAIMCHQFGFPHAVATLGTALTADHVKSLRNYVDRVILVFDSDEAGQRAADRALEVFIGGRLEVFLATVPKGKDPADFLPAEGKDAFEAVLTSATGALEFKWQQVLRRNRSGGTGADRRRAVEEYLALIARAAEVGSADPIQRGLIVNQVAKFLGVASEEVSVQLGGAVRQARRTSGPGNTASTRVGMSKGVPDVGSIAAREILEVLLNEPSAFEWVGDHFDPDALTDLDRAIACVVRDLAKRPGGFGFNDVLGGCGSVALSNRAMELRHRGQDRGNFEATIQGAVSRIVRTQHSRRTEQLGSTLRQQEQSGSKASENATDSVEDPGDDRVSLRTFTDASKQVSHFAARRHLAMAAAKPVRDEAAPPSAPPTG